jgi:toxin secretion/phage lysis holin
VAIFILVGIGHLIDTYILRDGSALRTAILFFYIANEGLSVLENSVTLGLPVPAKLRQILQQLQDKSDNTEGK